MYNLIDQTLDGKKLTNTDFDGTIIGNLKEGRDVTVWDGQQTITLLARNHDKVVIMLMRMDPGQTIKSGGRVRLEVKPGTVRTYTQIAMTEGLAKTCDGQTTTTTTDVQTATLTGTQATVTSDDGETLTKVDRVISAEVHKSLIQLGRDGNYGNVGQTTETDGQVTLTRTDEQITMVVMEELVEEQAIVEETDPLALSPASSAVDPLALPLVASEAVGGDLDVTLVAPPSPPEQYEYVLPISDVVPIADDGSNADRMESVIRIGKKVVGRKRAVLIDDESDMTAMSVSSADEESSLAISSSRPGGSKGIKRKLRSTKEKNRRERIEDMGNNEEGKGNKKKGKKKEERKDTPEGEGMESDDGELRGLVDHILEDMSSEILGGVLHELADSIEDARVKSKNMQGKLSGRIKRNVEKIKSGIVLLVSRALESGDPQFLRKCNSELAAQLQESERKNALLQEQLRNSPGMPSPPRKKKKEKSVMVDAANAAIMGYGPVVDSPSPVEEFPPLPQRAPRTGVSLDGDGRKRVGPRIVSDVQLVPPSKERRIAVETTQAVSGAEAEWRVAAGSRRRGKVKTDNPPQPSPHSHPPPPLPAPARGRPPPPVRQQQPKVKLPKPPLFSAVIINGKSEGFSYADAMKKVRESIDLKNLGITSTQTRKAINGGLLIEVKAEDSRLKAEELVAHIRDVLKDSAAISCPVKKRELTVAGFDESITAEDIIEELSKVGGCPIADIKTGPIRTLNSGLGMIWVQLPVSAAAKVAEEGRIRVGWTSARVELLKVRPLQCFKCWSYGHVQSTCRNAADRRGACFKCGEKGHLASTCTNPVHCALCHEGGLEATHRMGGPQCMVQERQALKKR